MAAVTMSLGSGDQTESDVEDMISSEIKRTVSKQMYQFLHLQLHLSRQQFSCLVV